MSDRVFPAYPDEGKATCPICKTNENKPCFLIPIDGTDKDGICEAVVVHVGCLTEHLGRWRINKSLGVIYMDVRKE